MLLLTRRESRQNISVILSGLLACTQATIVTYFSIYIKKTLSWTAKSTFFSLYYVSFQNSKMYSFHLIQ